MASNVYASRGVWISERLAAYREATIVTGVFEDTFEDIVNIIHIERRRKECEFGI